MAVPTHSEGCKTQTWATRCRDCDEPVYFFSCSCGSRVLFDRLGEPWPLHADRCIPHLINQLKAQSLNAVHIRQVVDAEAERRGVAVPSGVWSRLRANEYAEKRKPLVVTLEPGGTEQELVGRILVANLQVNFYKRLRYPKNSFSDAFLGKLVESSYVEITIREDPDKVTGICAEAECFMPLTEWRAKSLSQGDRAAVFLVPHHLPNDRWVWLVDHAECIR